MQRLKVIKARYPKLFSVVTLALAVGTVGAVAAYERRANASESCCYPGSPCCHPGSPCCNGHK